MCSLTLTVLLITIIAIPSGAFDHL
jgi:hypothetical protein